MWTKKGFSLLELLVVVSIIGILAAVGYPNYVKFKLESRREDAHAALITLQATVERFLIERNNPKLTQADVDSDRFQKYRRSGVAAADRGKSKAGLYDMFIEPTATGGYVLSAESPEDSKQAGDIKCRKMTIDQDGTRRSYTIDDTETTGCW